MLNRISRPLLIAAFLGAFAGAADAQPLTADPRDIHFESQVISANGHTGVAHRSAQFRLQSSGATVELDGVFALKFSESGECSSLREWWHVRAPP